MQRTRALHELTHGRVDVLVVGGGVVGAGAALDAASRGLTVGLLEQDDWASGTSSRSSRLAHGGLRYLEQREFGLVHEALTERGLLLEHLAPHLVRPVRFVFPLATGWERPYVGAGVALYDVLARFGARSGTLPGHRHLSRRAALRLFPALNPESLAGAITFFDAQIDDARHTLATVRTAVRHGTHAVSRMQVTDLIRQGDGVVGVRALDRVAGTAVEIRARAVVFATGVWGPVGLAAPTTVAPSKGVHLVVPKSAVVAHTALIARTGSSVLFCLPWEQHWLIGTTDTPWTGRLGVNEDDVRASDDDIDYLLDEANRWLRRPLTRSDVVGVYAGLRPLVSDEPASDTTRVSREHQVSRLAPGLVSVAGGKYTTYRVMAADVIDAAVAELPQDRRPGPSRTAALPLVGADDFAALWQDRHRLALEHGQPVAVVEHLLRRHGDQVVDVLDLADATAGLGRPVAPGVGYLEAEVVHAAAEEGAMEVADVVSRRTRMSTEVADAARPLARTVAGLMAPVLGWSADDVDAATAEYVGREH